MRITSRILMLLFLGSVWTGCVQVDSTITLAEDLSGSVDFSLVLNMEDMLVAVVTMQKSFTGDTSPPTKAELEEARAEMLAQLEGDDMEPENLAREFGSGLPAGVKLVRAGQRREGMKLLFRMEFAFSELSLLTGVNLQPGGQRGPGPDGQPFEGLEVVEEGETLVIRTTPSRSITETKNAAGGMLGEALVGTMFGDLKVAFSIEAPFEVVEHNATAHVGNRLSWLYAYEGLDAAFSDSVFVRYRRPGGV